MTPKDDSISLPLQASGMLSPKIKQLRVALLSFLGWPGPRNMSDSCHVYVYSSILLVDKVEYRASSETTNEQEPRRTTKRHNKGNAILYQATRFLWLKFQELGFPFFEPQPV